MRLDVKFSAAIVACLALIALGPSAAPALTIYDHFDDDSFDETIWDITYEHPTVGYLTESGTEVSISHRRIQTTATYGPDTSVEFKLGDADPFGLCQMGFLSEDASQFAIFTTRDDPEPEIGAPWMLLVKTSSWKIWRYNLDAPVAGDVYRIDWATDYVSLYKNAETTPMATVTKSVPDAAQMYVQAISYGNPVEVEPGVFEWPTIVLDYVATGALGSETQPPVGVPEPSMLVLLLTLSLGLLVRRRR